MITKKEFNAAAARLVYDFVGADGFVSDRELAIMENLKDKYDMKPERMAEINGLSFCKALEKVQNYGDKKAVKDLKADLELVAGYGQEQHESGKFSRIEGHCSLAEAWLLLAIKYALEKDATVFSLEGKKYRFSRAEIIYLEKEECNEVKHREIENHYEEYKAKLGLYGMRLVYIPKVCKFLESKDQENLVSLMRYVNPFKVYRNDDARKIVQNLQKYTTSEFAKDIFEGHLDLYKDLRPSFLLKIKTSVVGNDDSRSKMSDFILIPVEDSVTQTLEEALEIYTSYTLDLHFPDKILHGYPFALHGFDRTFLNFVMERELSTDVLTKLTFDFYDINKCVVFNFGDKRSVKIPLGNKDMCLYLLIIIFSFYNKSVKLKNSAKGFTRKISDEERVFQLIYNKVKREKDNSDLYEGDGECETKITNLLKRLNNRNIHSDYKVQRKKGEKKAHVTFAGKDLVYVKLGSKETLLYDELDRRMVCYSGNITKVCEDLFG